MHKVLFFITTVKVNYSLLTGGVPFSFREWSGRGINILSDISDDVCLRLFNGLRVTYNIPGTSFFLYLYLRSAMRAYSVPWGTPLLTHKLHTLLDVGVRSRGLISALYSFLLASSCGPLATHQVWTGDLDLPSDEIC